MFAHLRSKNTVLARYQFLPKHIAIKMRDNVRNQVSPLTGFDWVDPSNSEVVGILAEIHMREFACMLQTLTQVSYIASRYHEHAFDNTDAYINAEVQPVQLSPHEMTAEQRHASQLLLGVGRNHSEVNAALKCIELTRRDVMECDVAKMRIVAQQFQDNVSVAEDAFDRLQHITKQVWSLVNMLAFSNLFRFADPSQPIGIPNQDDAIFIPHIPIVRQAEEVQVQQTCHVCAQSMNTPQKHFNEIAEQLADEKITPEQACSLIEELRDAGIIADAMDTQNEQQKGFNEIAAVLADWQITTEEACELFTEWISEHSK